MYLSVNKRIYLCSLINDLSVDQDIIKEAQVSLALTIDGLLEARQKTDLTNIIIICIIFSAVLILCPIIIYAVYSLTVEIQRCSIHIADRYISQHATTT